MTGKMPSILFDFPSLEGDIAQGRAEVRKMTNALKSHQRSKLIFASSPDRVSLKENNIDLLVVKAEFDGLENSALALDFDTLYFLNSKATLCISRLLRYVERR